MFDKNISPVGWYVGSYLIRFISHLEQGNDDLEKRFLSWENTVIVKAKSIDEAYEKVVIQAQEASGPYMGGKDMGGEGGEPVEWVFEGVTDLLPIYEELADGAEIMWAEHKPKKLKTIKKLVKAKGKLTKK